MSNTLNSSPDRPKVGSSKIKYTGKAKVSALFHATSREYLSDEPSERKRNVSNVAEDSSGEESDTHQSITNSDPQETSLSESKAAPKMVEIFLPGPSPPRSPCNSQESPVLSAKPTSKTRGPRSSSVVSLNRSIRHESPSALTVRAKSSDKTSPAPKVNCPNTPDDDADETSSIAESSAGARIRRSEPERIQYFKGQSLCDDVESHRAHCVRCNKWISLGKRQTYTVRYWEIHRRRCDQRTPVLKLGRRDETELEKSEAEALESELSMEITKQPSPQPAQKSDAERKALLEEDPRAQEVKPHEVLCRSCQKWIKLSIDHVYLLGNWLAHQQRCSGVIPSSRVATAVATAERKHSLLNDPQAKSSSPRHVECAFCRTNVELDGVAQYDLTKWHEHKAKCTSHAIQSTPKAPNSRRSRVFPTPSSQAITQTPTSEVHKPLASSSSASIDATAINNNSPSRIGEKRARDEEDAGEDRPVNRPRTETYEAPKNEAPGPWGWFMQPFKAFVRGFREGLGTSST
ncbi:hypothetical protein DEU56DRAFT_819149 [Suillus clintonianus]|uniref:uncharacterized protein n=1 Tax=Suillus clintonianus TaxID=1904413 RepID=UPI001B86EEEB|nr:uncharacterized protein DEU56DRAFT_819149 [Suillus clintonianus]KAG2128594.1 hypothetical protein DEU56DRAFT_819149 [Suillus clintonianus]